MKAKHYFDLAPKVRKGLLQLNKQRDFIALEKELEKRLVEFPNSSFLHNLKGSCLANQNKLEESINSFNSALESTKAPEVILNNIGVTQIKLNYFEDSVESFNKAIECKADYAEPYFNLGTALRKLGRIKDAVDSYETACQINPHYAKAFLYKSLSLKNLGNFQDSIISCKEAIKLRSDYGIAHRHLSSMLTYLKKDDSHLKQMVSVYKRELINSEDRIQLAFGLGKAYEDLAEYEKAFNYFEGGNRLYRDTIKYSTEGRERFFSLLKENFDKDFFASYKSLSTQGEKMIFVLGMPRSGTSLVEQILSSHSRVYGAGELRYLKEAVDSSLTSIEGYSFPKNIKLHDPKSFDLLGLNYLKLIEKLGKDKGRLVVDKMPYNFMHIGVISCSLPKAKIILCEREPLDNCFSIYKQKFGIGNDFAYSLKETGEYYNLYRNLINHWESVLPKKMLRVSYEDLIDNQEKVSKKMIDFCQLDWEEECLNFHSTKRAVNTASAVQVRKPIYKTSVNLWEKYKNNLNPLITELSKG